MTTVGVALSLFCFSCHYWVFAKTSKHLSELSDGSGVKSGDIRRNPAVDFLRMDSAGSPKRRRNGPRLISRQGSLESLIWRVAAAQMGIGSNQNLSDGPRTATSR